MRNYENAINEVLTKTNFSVALIPHVNWNYNATDFTALDELHRKFHDNPRVHYIEEHGAEFQKYIISMLKAFVVTRTHAAIAALGSKIPVVITGYKTKSRGIAADIFQGKFDVTADVQSLRSEHDVSDKLFSVIENEESIRKFYDGRMPEYFSGLDVIRNLILSLHS